MSQRFDELVQPYRAELLAHCYRMCGALSDAEDALQNALVRAWKAFDSFEGRSSLRTWLYKITTNACLDVLATRKQRSMPELVENPEDAVDPAWLEPFPQPDETLANREAVRLAFVIALQVLPAKQRAALILRDVVGMSAEETAATLDITVAAANSALQRARAVLDEHPRAKRAPICGKLGELLGKYLALWEAGDARGLVALLRHDAVLSMPPHSMWAKGPDAIADLLEKMVFPLGAMRCVPTTMNGSPAFAVYIDGGLRAISVLDIEDDKIVSIHSFIGVDAATHHLPPTIPIDAAPLKPGAALGRYQLEHIIGSGGMGHVWLAHDRELGRDVALKVLRDELAQDGQARTRLEREARAMAKLKHPNVLAVYDVSEIAGHAVLAMELVDGDTLGRWAMNSRGEAELLDVLVSAGRGLAAAHAAELVHRDFKPDNVLVGRDGRVLVSDFGLARSPGERPSLPAIVASSERATAVGTPAIRREVEHGQTLPQGSPPGLTRPDVVMGTPAYMAPEQRRAEDTDARSDQFAFCVTAWELFANKAPFTLEELDDLARGGFVMARYEDRIPARIRQVLLRGLSPKADDRWPSMDALLDALRG